MFIERASRLVLLVAAIALLPCLRPSPAAGQTGPAAGAAVPDRYVIDPAHTSVEFAVRHLGLSKVRGTFSTVAGTLFYDSLHPERSSVTVVIETGSIDTRNERRDDDLRENFFDVERFPRMTFQSTRVERGPSGYVMRGLLAIRDSVRNVAMPVSFLGGYVDDVSGERRVGFEGTLEIDRTSFGVAAPDHPAEVRLVIGHDIEIDLQVEARIPGYGGTSFASANGRSIGEELEAVLEAAGPDAARRRYEEVEAAPAGFDLASRELALLGFRRLQAGDAAGAVVAFELYARAEPSATADEWLGSAYLAADRPRDALAAYERALAADPWRTTAVEGRRLLLGTTDEPSLPRATPTVVPAGAADS